MIRTGTGDLLRSDADALVNAVNGVGLRALRHTLVDLGLTSVAIPTLGAGHGGLDWGVVRPRIEAALRDLEGVTVHLWDPGQPPAAANRPPPTGRPR